MYTPKQYTCCLLIVRKESLVTKKKKKSFNIKTYKIASSNFNIVDLILFFFFQNKWKNIPFRVLSILYFYREYRVYKWRERKLVTSVQHLDPLIWKMIFFFQEAFTFNLNVWRIIIGKFYLGLMCKILLGKYWQLAVSLTWT